jgi:hypothetical protein
MQVGRMGYLRYSQSLDSAWRSATLPLLFPSAQKLSGIQTQAGLHPPRSGKGQLIPVAAAP